MTKSDGSMGKACVIGAGAYGCALACVAARAGFETVVWGRSATTVAEINQSHTNNVYLNGLELEPAIIATSEVAEALAETDLVILSVPTQSLSDLLPELKSHFQGDVPLVSSSKGIDRKTGKLPNELIKAQFPNAKIGVLSGPSFASDVVRNLPTAVSIAADEIAQANQLASMLSSSTFRCYANDDPRGVELGGALKNVLAVAVGITRGMGLGASAEAALITRGFTEMRRLAEALGAKRDTLLGLSGFGDFVLTCSSEQSRNFTYGIALGRGADLTDMKLAEGVFTAGIASELAEQSNVDVPIIDAVVGVLEKRVTAQEAVESLLMRPLKQE